MPVEPAAAEALLAVADANVVVLRGCYLALRRAVRMPATADAAGAVLIEEPGRALGARDVADVLGVPVLATVVGPIVGRARDRRRCVPGADARRVGEARREVLARIGCSGREGRAA